MKHVVKYTYESGNLATVTQPGESAPMAVQVQRFASS